MKRILAIVLTAVLLLAALPVFADDETVPGLLTLPTGTELAQHLEGQGETPVLPEGENTDELDASFSEFLSELLDELLEQMEKTPMVFSALVPAEEYSWGELFSEVGTDYWALIPFLDGYAATYPEAGVILYTEGNEVEILGEGFDYPTGLTTDLEGNLLVAETGAGRIDKISKENGKSTEYVDGLLEPTGIDFTPDGYLLVAETGRNRILCYNADVLSEAAYVIGSAIPDEEENEYVGGYVDGPVSMAQFDHPQGVVFAEDGAIYIADTNNHAIRRIYDGRVYTAYVDRDLAGSLVKPTCIWTENDMVCTYDAYFKAVAAWYYGIGYYTDVMMADWYALPVAEASLRLIVEGDGEFFLPDNDVTRAEFVTMLSRVTNHYDGSAVIRGDAAFSDVAEGDWFFDAVNWAAENGIVEGYDGKFSPNAPITRQDMFVMLSNYAKFAGLDTFVTADLSGYTDTADIADYAERAFLWTVGSGIVEGFEDSTLRPVDTANRAQAVQILINYMDLYEAE